MTATWILVANRAKARLFAIEEEDALVEIESFVNPEGRAAGRETTRDRPPRTHDRFGESRHAVEPHTELRDKAAEKFARTLDDALERGRVEHQYERLVLFASPDFLGKLNATLGKQVQNRVVAATAKDLTTATAATILSSLPH